jgi:UDPglucose--hexose-1-phosphate uridylyltransferase
VLINDAWLDRAAPPAPPPDRCWYCEADGPVILADGHVRAVPHPVPAAGIEGDPRPIDVGGAVRMEGVGAHELVFGAHDEPETALLRVVAARVADLRKDPRLRGFGAARRHRPGHHAAWQVFALPFDLAPSAPAAWRDAEVVAGERIVARSSGAVAVVAWAPRAPFETWVIPEGDAPFAHHDPAPVAALVTRVRALLSRALRDAPIDLVLADGRPWRIELVPRLGETHAVEVATGVPLHGTFPEAAARHLRGLEEPA